MEKIIGQKHSCQDFLIVDKPSGIPSVGNDIAIKYYLIPPPQAVAITKSACSLNFEQQIPNLLSTKKNYLSIKAKRLMDISLSLFALTFGLPFMAIIALIIKISSKGPILYCQTRTGLKGREFKIYKFRTMSVNSDMKKDELMALNEMDGPIFKIKNDPRITLFGNFLRRSSLDEFPQFINVLLNDMSVVGPRPPLPDEVKKYKPWQLQRISIKPGITCIWQVSGRNKVGFEEWMRMDLKYIEQWSLKLDLLICLKTIKTVFSMNGM